MNGSASTVPTTDGFVTISEAVDYLQVCRSTLYKLMDRGELAFAKFGNCRRIPRAALAEYARRNTVAAR
jgi:excisionase family DNA binding protein